MSTINPNNGNETNTFFYGTYSNLISFFIGYKYFNDFYNWHLSVSLQK